MVSVAISPGWYEALSIEAVQVSIAPEHETGMAFFTMLAALLANITLSVPFPAFVQLKRATVPAVMFV